MSTYIDEWRVPRYDMVPLKVASMVIKSLLFNGTFNKYIRCLDGSETNLSGPTAPLKAAQRKGTMPHTK